MYIRCHFRRVSINVGGQIGYDVDGEPAENVDDVDVWEYPY
jgi:hypothetical protein